MSQRQTAIVACYHKSFNGRTRRLKPASQRKMATVDFRDRLLQCLGGQWPPPRPLHAQTLHIDELEGGIRREKVAYEAEPGEMVPAYLLLPSAGGRSNPAPGICVWHQHHGAWHVGASEPAGLAGMPMHHTGVALAREGYVVL